MVSKNSFGAAGTLRVNDREYQIYRLHALEGKGGIKIAVGNEGQKRGFQVG